MTATRFLACSANDNFLFSPQTASHPAKSGLNGSKLSGPVVGYAFFSRQKSVYCSHVTRPYIQILRNRFSHLYLGYQALQGPGRPVANSSAQAAGYCLPVASLGHRWFPAGTDRPVCDCADRRKLNRRRALPRAARLIGVTLSSPFFHVSSMFAHCCISLARSPKYLA